jgi:hypothetical protein
MNWKFREFPQTTTCLIALWKKLRSSLKAIVLSYSALWGKDASQTKPKEDA